MPEAGKEVLAHKEAPRSEIVAEGRLQENYLCVYLCTRGLTTRSERGPKRASRQIFAQHDFQDGKTTGRNRQTAHVGTLPTGRLPPKEKAPAKPVHSRPLKRRHHS